MLHRRRVLGVALGGALGWVGRDAAGQAGKAIEATGPTRPALAPFDRMMDAFMRRTGVPGAGLAVAKEGRLVYARGFGWADVEAREPVRPGSRFRVASVSKPITGVAVMHLVGEGKLRLRDKMIDLLKLKPTGDSRLAEITVEHLLHHTAGWDRDKSGDPMFRPVEIAQEQGVPAPAGPSAIVDYMVKRPLDFAPGSRFAYSNFGYCVLGLIIEAATGRGYEAFVRRQILAPLGVRSMQLGRTLADQRAASEVRYYAEGSGPGVVGPTLGKPDTPPPYGGFALEAMAAHGGWIATPADLVRFATQFARDGDDAILTPPALRALLAPPPGGPGHAPDGTPKASYYAAGWSTVVVGPRARNQWHAGSLEGTSSLLVRRHDGLAWAALFNSRKDTGKLSPADMIDPLLHRAADAVRTWPDIDLFRNEDGPRRKAR